MKSITEWVIVNTEDNLKDKQARIFRSALAVRATKQVSLVLIILFVFTAMKIASAASYVTLGCTKGGSGSLQGCPDTLNQAQVGTFAEPASFTYSAGDTNLYREVTGSYSQGAFSSTVPSFDAIVTVGPASIDVGSSFSASFGFDNQTGINEYGQYAAQTISGSGWLPGM